MVFGDIELVYFYADLAKVLVLNQFGERAGSINVYI